MQPDTRPCVYQERKTHHLSPVPHKLKLCERLLHAGTSLNTFAQHTVERLFLWPENKTRAMKHPLVCGVMSSDHSKPLCWPSRVDHGCFNVVSSDAHLPSPWLLAGCISPVLHVSSVASTAAFGVALAVSLVGHFSWILVLALPLGFVAKHIAVYGADFLPWEAAWLCLRGAWVVNQ